MIPGLAALAATVPAAPSALIFHAPYLDYHALAPEIVLSGTILVVLLVDLLVDDARKTLVSTVGGLGLLGSMIPIVTLALHHGSHLRPMFGGAYVVDNFALVLKGLFLFTGYVVFLISTNYIEEGDYHQGEYTFLLLCSIFGMVVMSSARDLLTIFVALEMLSVPAYLLAGWRKRDLKSNEAMLKYYLLGVLATGVMLYGMSLIIGVTGTSVLSQISAAIGTTAHSTPVVSIGIVFILVGFSFKISAVPFHFWAPDTYEGSPTPVTAFLSVASKTGGFVALMELVYAGFFPRHDVWMPLFWALAALTMTVGNLVALRQTNIVRMLAYSSIAQAGYILVPFAVAASNATTDHVRSVQTASIVYLLIYSAMNLGAFAVVIAVARKTRSGEISSYGGLIDHAPGLTVVMTVFLFSLAGIPPFGGWFAKFYVFRAVIDASTPAATVLGVIVAVNSVIALFYYAGVARQMWFSDVPDEDRSPIRVPPPLAAALGLTAAMTVAIGIYPNLFARMGDVSSLVH